MPGFITQVIPFVKGDTIEWLEESVKSTLDQEPCFDNLWIVQGVKSNDITKQILDEVLLPKAEEMKEKLSGRWLVRGLVEESKWKETIEFAIMQIKTAYTSILRCGDTYSTQQMVQEARSVFDERIEAFNARTGPFPPAIMTIPVQGIGSSAMLRLAPSFVVFTDAMRKIINVKDESIADLDYDAKLEAVITSTNEKIEEADQMKIEDAYYSLKQCEIIERNQ